MYDKKEGVEGSFDKSSMLLEEPDSISSLIDDEDDNERDKRLDETDFIDYCEKTYDWLHILILGKLLVKINAPEQVFQDSFETGYDYKQYQRKDEQVPYVLRDLNKEEEDSKKEEYPLILPPLREEQEKKEKGIKPEETDSESGIKERKAA